MRLAALACLLIFLNAACERKTEEARAPEPAASFEVKVSDELPGLSAPATGVAFWAHPALSFNSLMIVANQDGVVSYNIEDGNEVSRIPGVNAQGAALSYLGFGAQAAGVLAIFDTDESAFRLYGVDNASRTFLAIDGGPTIRGAVRGFCFGRAHDIAAPSLFVVQKAKVSIFNMEATDDGVAVTTGAVLKTPGNLTSCAVDIDGTVLAVSKDGDIYRVTGDNSFAKAFASAAVTSPGDMAVISTEITSENDTAISSQIILLDRNNGALHIFDRHSGRALGIVMATGTDELEGVSAASAFGVTSGNLGALYRNGVVAFATGLEDPSLRLIPASGIINALTLPEGDPVSPRGALPVAEEDNDLLIKTGFQPQ